MIKKLLSSIRSMRTFTRNFNMDTYKDKVKKVYTNEAIIRSPNDKRDYRCLELTNGMSAFLISDPQTDRSAAALDVHIGNMSDPSELPGLAHFCEHMLFLGTEKYPDENEYNKFLNEHGGGSNASTSTEHTTYHFSVGPQHLAGALDRFGQFFLSPLFTESATEREVNAVNSENDKNVKNDSRRIYQLNRMLSQSDHPYARFGTGNKECLETIPKEKGIDVRSELLTFHGRNYSANIMQLCILGKESLDELSEMVLKLFPDVVNKNVDIPEWPHHPYQSEQLQRVVSVVPVKDVRSLTLTWPVPDTTKHYHAKPGHYLSHLLGHEGPGSVLSLLMELGWSSSLTAGRRHGARGFDFFYVTVDLSEDGLDHKDDIVTMVYQYINMLKKEGIQKWIFEECKLLKEMRFRFKDKEHPTSYVTSLARDNHMYSVEERLQGPYILSEYKPDLIQMILDKLTPTNMRLMVVSKKFEGLTDMTERWYGTHYKVESIAADKIQKWEKCGFHDKLHLPEKNEFIPENLDLVPKVEVSMFPQIIRNDKLVRLWYKQDDTFLLPKSFVTLTLFSPHAYLDPSCLCMCSLFTSLLDDALTELTYSAYLAGLSYHLSSSRDGITISTSGYSDKQTVLLEKILHKMAHYTVDMNRFTVQKEKLERRYRNFSAEQPHTHATYSLSQILTDMFWTKEEALRYLKEVTAKTLQDFIRQFLSRLYIEGLVYGNVTKQGAHDMMSVVEKQLTGQAGTKPLFSSQHPVFREVHLPQGSHHRYQLENDVHKSGCVVVYYQCGLESTDNNVLLELTKQVLGEPAFNTLRTKEQLGYIVWTRVRRSYGAQGLRVLVQSDKSPEYVEGRIEAFLNSMESVMCDMGEEEFERHVSALETRRLEKPKKMSSQNNHFLSEIDDQVYHFDRDNIEMAHLRTLKREDLFAFFKEHLSCDSKVRRKLTVHVVSTSQTSDAQEDSKHEQEKITPHDKQPVMITDIDDMKRSLPLYPRLKPVIDVSLQGVERHVTK